MNIIPIPILLILQLIPFLVTLIALYFILFKPMLQFLEDRDHSTEGARKRAEDLHQQSSEKMESLEQQLTDARTQIGEKRANVRAEATKQYNEMVKQARHDAETEVKKAIDEIQIEQEAARATLRNSANQIANQIASQALGRDIA